MMKQKWIDAYMDTAHRFAELSSCVKLKVGAVVVKDNRIISIGYNGTPSGWDNCCEVETESGLVTKDEVIHAEANAIQKLALSPESAKFSSLFCTHSPCIHCAKMIAGSGIVQVFYGEDYRSDDGVKFLKKSGVSVKKVEKNA
jgi:dCMP deaminase